MPSNSSTELTSLTIATPRGSARRALSPGRRTAERGPTSTPAPAGPEGRARTLPAPCPTRAWLGGEGDGPPPLALLDREVAAAR
jgi:hypothetical protein